MSKFKTAQEIFKEMESYFSDSKEANKEYISKEDLIELFSKVYSKRKSEYMYVEEFLESFWKELK